MVNKLRKWWRRRFCRHTTVHVERWNANVAPAEVQRKKLLQGAQRERLFAQHEDH